MKKKLLNPGDRIPNNFIFLGEKMNDDEFDPFMDALRQMKSDMRQIEIDIGLIQNEELRVMARNLLFSKQDLYLSMVKSYAMPEARE